MSRKVKTEHAGAKKAQGYWGSKEEAKRISRKTRRSEARKILVREIKEFKGRLRFRRDTATSRHHPRGEPASSSIDREVLGTERSSEKKTVMTKQHALIEKKWASPDGSEIKPGALDYVF